jgi:succinyl-CoA synthetase alpha subunit
LPASAAVKPGYYKDSVALMRVAQQIAARHGVSRATLVMGTPANKGILEDAGMLDARLGAATPGDLLIAVEASSQREADEAVQEAERILASEAVAGPAQATAAIAPRSVAMALEGASNATLAQVSVPGPYAAAEALKALKRGLHVFLFSDNVPLEQERAIKAVAEKKGLLVMGPDCGTAILGGVPLGFANAVRRGTIGVVGASGTGIQQVTTLVHQYGHGISHAIGTGSRDVLDEVGGITLKRAFAMLVADAETSVIVIVSKPPAKSVADHLLDSAARAGKPVVVLFLGAQGLKSGGNVTVVATLEEAATAAVALATTGTYESKQSMLDGTATLPAELSMLAPTQRYVRGLYSGGTFCTEAQLVLRAAGVLSWSNVPLDKSRGIPDRAPSVSHCLIDLGADEFTVGRPHPMIDHTVRGERLVAEARDPETALVLLDVVLGYGSHPDPAGALAPAIRAARAVATRGGRHLILVGFICGTEDDPQHLSAQSRALREAGVNVVSSSTAAARLAASAVAARSVSIR